MSYIVIVVTMCEDEVNEYFDVVNILGTSDDIEGVKKLIVDSQETYDLEFDVSELVESSEKQYVDIEKTECERFHKSGFIISQV